MLALVERAVSFCSHFSKVNRLTTASNDKAYRIRREILKMALEGDAEGWISKYLKSPKNLATEVELREQARIAINYFKEADTDGGGSLSFQELKRLCDQMGLPMENDEEEMLMKMDTDDSGALDIDEWGFWWLGRVSSLPNPAKQ